MIETDGISHARQTAELWARIGRQVAAGAPDGSERRVHPRFLAEGAACQLDVVEAADARTMKVAVRDVCEGGACLLAEAALPVTTCVRLHPPGNAYPGMESIDGAVAYCRGTDHRFRIGIRFAS